MELSEEEPEQTIEVISKETTGRIHVPQEEKTELVEEGAPEIQYGVPRSNILKTGYAYDTLAVDEQIVYEEILNGLLELQEETIVSTLDEGVLERVFVCVMNDHQSIKLTHQ